MSALPKPAGSSSVWQCGSCDFIYDPAEGYELEHIAAGTAWADVPEDWRCPDCGSSKSDFLEVSL